MPRTTVYIISDDTETIEKAKTYFGTSTPDCSVASYQPGQWKEGLEQPSFRLQLSQGIPALATGFSQGERDNVLPFPSSSTGGDMKVSTMNELESKAIEGAIMQYRGNLTEAAKALGIGRATLYRKVKQYQIDPSQARKKRAA